MLFMLGREDDKIVGNKLREYLLSLLPEDIGILKEIKDRALREGVPLLMEETARFLEVLVRLKKPQRLLEAGTGIGYSSILMCKALEGNVRIDTIESNFDSASEAKNNIKKAGYEQHIHVIVGDVIDVFSNLQGQYDMIFMDAAKSLYKEALPLCTRLLKEEGLLISDNVLFKGMISDLEVDVKKHRTSIRSMREYLDLLCHEGTYATSLIPLGDGVAVSLKNKENR
jgi:predicted O-methyltransferase YrrM